jgi:hypothetical protein
MRHVVLHYHVFKNAGSTVHAALRQAFGSDACGRLEGAQQRRTLGAGQIVEHLRAHPQLQALSSHQARLPVPQAPDITFHPLLFLRHPIDRAGSVYAFERRQPVDSPSLGAAVARERDLAGYVRWRLEPGNGSVIRNFQTVHLSSRFDDMRIALAGEEDLAVALERLRQLPFIGLVERTGESLQRLRAWLQPAFGPLELPEERQNASGERAGTLRERLAGIEAALGPQLHRQLLEHNRLDLALHAAAVRRFDQG